MATISEVIAISMMPKPNVTPASVRLALTPGKNSNGSATMPGSLRHTKYSPELSRVG